jgi:hypothetical protein
VAQKLENKIQVSTPSFSGNWKLNPSKSDFGRKEETDRLDRIMTIEQTSVSISVTIKLQKSSAQDANFVGGKYTLLLDGRGDQYLGYMGDESVSKLENGKLVVTHYVDGSNNSDRFVAGYQVFSLSSDGKTLTETWKVSAERLGLKTFEREKFEQQMSEKLVYDRL